MSSLRWLKKTCVGFISLFLTIPGKGMAKDSKEVATPAPEVKQEEAAKAKFSKEELNTALRKMERDPKSIKTIGAMCYEMAMQSKEVEFPCTICGHTKIYLRNSNEGSLSSDLPYVRRSLESMPYRISIDASGLCPICGKGKARVLVAHVRCFDCCKEFTWEIQNAADIEMLKWLYIKPPIIQLDSTTLNLWNDPEKKIKEGAEYIRNHVYCPVCREKVKL